MIRDFDPRLDTDAVIELARELHGESPEHRGMPFDPAHVEATILAPHIKGWVASRGAGLTGYCFAAIVKSLFGPATYCCDVSLYVRPPFRNGFVALGLIRRREAWGKQMGAMRHQAAVSTGLKGAAGLYQALGYQSRGGCYTKPA